MILQVATAQGVVYQYSLDPDEGGDCQLQQVRAAGQCGAVNRTANQGGTLSGGGDR